MRKLYRAVKKACKVSTAIELRSRSGGLIVKDDRRLTAAAITGPTDLLLRILPTPDVFTIFVTLPGRHEQSTIHIEEVISDTGCFTVLGNYPVVDQFLMHPLGLGVYF